MKCLLNSIFALPHKPWECENLYEMPAKSQYLLCPPNLGNAKITVKCLLKVNICFAPQTLEMRKSL